MRSAALHALAAMAAAAALTVSAATAVPASARAVDLVRVPHGGIQPEVALDAGGTVHMVYLAGAPAAADVFYVRSADGGRTFSSPLRVNSQPGSAIATGTIRGAHLAIGRGGRVHVAWNGSSAALPKPPAQPAGGRAGMPMLYARLDPKASAFTPQRNLMTRTRELDGGGSIAADGRGGVFVAWHGNALDGAGGEAARRVWLARSTDDGTTFAAETPVSGAGTGVCGCCALRLAAGADGSLHLLYRSASEKVHRDIYSLVSSDGGNTFTASRVHGWTIGACPMTSMALVPGAGLLWAWETDGQVHYSRNGGAPAAPPPATIEESKRRKHPRLAAGANGTVLLVWSEGLAWGRGGSAGWRLFDATGAPTELTGVAPGVPAWSFATVVARADGGFTILY